MQLDLFAAEIGDGDREMQPIIGHDGRRLIHLDATERTGT
jgi:hypothetical protein